jgi:hypothetical protein
MTSTASTPASLPTLRVMLRPAASYQELSRLPVVSSKWLTVRRPLLFAFVLGCTVSFAASGRLTLRLVVPATIYAAFVVVIEVVALMAVRPRTLSKARSQSFYRSVDLFFTGFGAWLLWLLSFAAIWTFASPVNAFRWAGPHWDLYVVGALALWSGYIDICFFRYVFQTTPQRAARCLLMQRAISWTLAVTIFGGGPLRSEIVRSLGI